jgi:hypothetical protein
MSITALTAQDAAHSPDRFFMTVGKVITLKTFEDANDQ